MRVCYVTSVVSDSLQMWTIDHQDPLSMGFSRQENWSWLPCPPPGDLPDAGIEPVSLMSPALSGRFFSTNATGDGERGVKIHPLERILKRSHRGKRHFHEIHTYTKIHSVKENVGGSWVLPQNVTSASFTCSDSFSHQFLVLRGLLWLPSAVLP